MKPVLISCLLLCFATATWAKELPVLPFEDHAEWQAIGRINASGYRKREMCTGTLIAPDKVLTAAHCLVGRKSRAQTPDEFIFVAGWLRGEAVDSIKGESIWIHPDAFKTGRLDLRFDIAILTLERASIVDPLPIAKKPPIGPFGLLGYSSTRPHMLGADFSCAAQVKPSILRLSCPVVPGNSGGPVLTKDGDVWKITAVISAMGREGSLAVPISRLSTP